MAHRCDKCGELLLGAVNRCWKCGTDILPARLADPPVTTTGPTTGERAFSRPRIPPTAPATPATPVRPRADERAASPSAVAVTSASVGTALGLAALAVVSINPLSSLLLAAFGLLLSLGGFASRRRLLPIVATVLCLAGLVLGIVPAMRHAYSLYTGEDLFAPEPADEELLDY